MGSVIKRFHRLAAMVRSTSVMLMACISLLLILSPSAQAQRSDPKEGLEAPLISLRDEMISYFRPLTGKVTSVQEGTVSIDVGSEESAKPGMRLHVYREGVSFIHPVTKEPLGRVEIPAGTLEIKETGLHDSSCLIISGKPEDFLNAKIKIPGTKVRVLFYQGTMDWYLGDLYHQMLRDSGRFELFDTGITTGDLSSIVAEAKAKGADVVTVLLTEESKDRVSLSQRIIWVSDAKSFSEKTVPVDAALVRDLKFRSRIIAPREGEALLSFSLPFGAQRLVVGDFDGDGSPDIVLVSGGNIRVYQLSVDLKLLWEWKIPAAGDVLWVDTADTNKNGRDEILVTSLHSGSVTSYVYELRDSVFTEIGKLQDTFIRKTDLGILGQRYNKRDGYEGKVFSVRYGDGAYGAGETLSLPPGINIYDFEYLFSPDSRQAILAWDEEGNLNLYDTKGTRMWISKEGFGGFSTAFKKDSSILMIDKGKWSIKDRLINKDGEVLAPKRVPLLGMAKGIGYKRSEIKSLWWNGFTVEERTFLDGISGEILDYGVMGDRIVVISKPLFGIKTGNILKGENPLGVMLYIFSIRGR